MRIGVAQIATRAGELGRTCERMVEQSRLAAEKNVDLLVFPLAALCGASPVSAVDREGFLLDVAGCVMRLAEELACPCLVPVLTEFDDRATAEALLIDGGDITPVRLAARLEAMAASGGDEPSDGLPELAFRGARLGVAFTYEELDAYDEYDYDVDVVIFLSGYGFAVDDPSSALGCALAESRFPADAEATGAWLVAAGSLGCYDAQVFCGSSFVLAPWGELAAQAPTLEEALLVCDVDPSDEGPLEGPLTPEVYDAPLMTWGALTLGLAEACGGEGRGACALAVGELPALLALTLAADALGPMGVRVLAPVTSRPESDAVALSLVRALRIPEDNVERVDVSGAGSPGLERDLAQAHLADLARRTGTVALGFADKTGLALEPQDGARASQLEPLADLYRSDVVALARMRNTMSPVVGQEAFAGVRVPEVEGLDAEFPAAETRLAFMDLVLSSYVEWELPVSDIAAERGHAAAVEAVVSRLRELEGARPACPPSFTLSTKTLDEARGPVGLSWRDRPREKDERLEGRLAQFASGAVAASQGGAPSDERGADRDRDVADLLGYLRDFSAGGGFSTLDGGSHDASGPAPGAGAPGTGLWDGPFSEN